MNYSSSVSVFPSYRVMESGIQKKHLQKHQDRIQGLKSHLSALEAKHDFSRDHEQIQLSIITLSAQNNQQKEEKQKLKVLNQEDRNHLSSGQQTESLNYYIEDDGQEENYETILKFKKKALERDLEEDNQGRGLFNVNEKKRQKQEEELFFRKLYVNEGGKDQPIGRKSASTSHLRKDIRRKTFNYKQAKQNSHKFVKKVHNQYSKGRKEVEERGKRLREPRSESGIESEIAAYEKNCKYLTENYLDILKKLDGTNMVKWRVLNGQRK